MASNRHLYDFITLSRAEAMFTAIMVYVFFDFFIYFYVAAGQFSGVNVVLLYSIPLLVLAVFAGAVGGNAFKFFFQTAYGKFVSRKQFFSGIIIALVVGVGAAYLMAFIGPSLFAIAGIHITAAYATLSVDPLSVVITNGVSSSYEFLFFLVVAVSEEALVIVTYKLLADSLYGYGLSEGNAQFLSLITVGGLWASLHWAAYGIEGIPVIAGIISAMVVGTVAFRLMSKVIYKDLDFSFMVATHWAYDLSAIMGILAISASIVH